MKGDKKADKDEKLVPGTDGNTSGARCHGCGKKGHIRVNCPFAGKGNVGAVLDAAEPRQAAIVGAITQVEPAVPPFLVLMTPQVANIPKESLLQILHLDAHSDGCMTDFVIGSGAMTHVLPFGLSDLQSSRI